MYSVNSSQTIIFIEDDAGNKTSMVLDYDILVDKVLKYNVNFSLDLSKGSTKSNGYVFTANVPFAQTSKEIIEYMVDGKLETRDSMKLAEWTCCLEYFDIDFTDEIQSLLKTDVTVEVYDLVHSAIRKRRYMKPLYIQFLVEKLPVDYDRKKFNQKLLKKAYSKNKRDYLIIYDTSQILICDPLSKSTICQITPDKFDYICSVKPHPNKPIIVVCTQESIAFHDVYTGNSIVELPITLSSSANAFCFTPDGNLIYLVDTSNSQLTITAYDTSYLEIHHRYFFDKSFTRSIHEVAVSPGGWMLAYTDTLSVYSLDLVSGITDIVCELSETGSINLQFVDDSTLIVDIEPVNSTCRFTYCKSSRWTKVDESKNYPISEMLPHDVLGTLIYANSTDSIITKSISTGDNHTYVANSRRESMCSNWTTTIYKIQGENRCIDEWSLDCELRYPKMHCAVFPDRLMAKITSLIN